MYQYIKDTLVGLAGLAVLFGQVGLVGLSISVSPGACDGSFGSDGFGGSGVSFRPYGLGGSCGPGKGL